MLGINQRCDRRVGINIRDAVLILKSTRFHVCQIFLYYPFARLVFERELNDAEAAAPALCHDRRYTID